MTLRLFNVRTPQKEAFEPVEPGHARVYTCGPTVYSPQHIGNMRPNVFADLLNRAGAPGNGFTFLMAGVATDYTEVMGLKERTGSWKIAFFLPLVTVPQVLVLGYLLNVYG